MSHVFKLDEEQDDDDTHFQHEDENNQEVEAEEVSHPKKHERHSDGQYLVQDSFKFNDTDGQRSKFNYCPPILVKSASSSSSTKNHLDEFTETHASEKAELDQSLEFFTPNSSSSFIVPIHHFTAADTIEGSFQSKTRNLKSNNLSEDNKIENQDNSYISKCIPFDDTLFKTPTSTTKPKHISGLTLSRNASSAGASEGNPENLEKTKEIITPTNNIPQDLPSAPSMSRQVSLRNFEILSVIGKGAYGKVFLVKRKSISSPLSKEDIKSNLFAMKVLRKAHIVLHSKDTEHTKNERSILEAVRHPFIVKLYYAFQTSCKLYLILSFAPGGELFTYLASEKMFAEPATAFYSGELLLALEHLHGLGIIYRDLKPENVLLGQDGHVLLTDFGLSKVALDAQTICGTPEFMAPEIIMEKTYDKTVDFWSLGIMIYDMLTGGPPFTGNNNKKIQDAILNKKLNCPKYMTPFAKDLCTRLLKKNPTQRLGKGPNGSKDIKSHSFFRKIDWKKLAKKECPPPIKPNLVSAEDISNFAKDFTSMPPIDTPPSAENSNTEPSEETLLARYMKNTKLNSCHHHNDVNDLLSPENKVDHCCTAAKQTNYVHEQESASCSNSTVESPAVDVKESKEKQDTQLFKGFSYVHEDSLEDMHFF